MLLKILLIILFSILFIISIYIAKNSTITIGCSYLEVLTLINLSAIYSINRINNGRILIEIILIIFLTLIFLKIFIPHLRLFRKKNDKKDVKKRKLSFLKSNIYLAYGSAVITFCLVIYLITVEEILPFQEIADYPLWSKFILLLSFSGILIIAISIKRKHR